MCYSKYKVNDYYIIDIIDIQVMLRKSKAGTQYTNSQIVHLILYKSADLYIKIPTYRTQCMLNCVFYFYK